MFQNCGGRFFAVAHKSGVLYDDGWKLLWKMMSMELEAFSWPREENAGVAAQVGKKYENTNELVGFRVS